MDTGVPGERFSHITEWNLSKSIKLNDDTFIDASGVYDKGTTQSSINDHITRLPYIGYADLPSQSTDPETYFREWIAYMVSHNIFRYATINIGCVQPNLNGWCIGYANDGAVWAGFTAQLYGDSALYRFGYHNGTWFFNHS